MGSVIGTRAGALLRYVCDRIYADVTIAATGIRIHFDEPLGST